jgi:uncharacterized protein YggE
MKIIASFFAFAALSTFSPGHTAIAADAARTIAVRGEGELKVAPDVAIVSLQVRARAKDAKAAQKANAEEMARVSKVLRGEFGLDAKEIQTSGISVNPDYRYERDGKRVFLGYEALHSLNARVKKLDRVGELLDKLPIGKAGDKRAVLLQGVSFDSDKRRDHETEALGLAMANAQARAAALAGFAKKGLKGVLRISDSNVNFRPYEPAMRGEAKMMTMMDSSAGSAPGTEVSAGEITITSNVAVEYEMD